MPTVLIVAESNITRFNAVTRAGWEIIPIANQHTKDNQHRSPEPDVIIYEVNHGPLHVTFQSYCLARLAPLLALAANWEVAWQAVESGADDALVVPFGEDELLFRIRRLVHTSQTIRVHHLVVDLKNKRAKLGNRILDLSPVELKLLICLTAHIGEVISYDQILDEAWDCHCDDGGTLEQVKTAVKRLRKKIEADPAHPQYLVSARSFGYRLRNQAQWDEEVDQSSG